MMKNNLLAFWRDEEGATAIEYGLIAGLISVVILVVVGDVGDNLKLIFQSIATALAPAA
jgi:pilus assembly protein Flp/PilA